MNAKDINARVKEHHARQKARGMKLVRVWVPEDAVERLQKYAARLRAEKERAAK